MTAVNRVSHALRILVVDDYADIAESMAILLRFDGHKVDVALDGPTALSIAEKNNPQVVLCDISMPKMTGNEVAHRLRGMFGDSQLLVAISANRSEEDCQRSQAAGFDHYLVKPAAPGEVRRLLRDFIASHN